MGRKVQAILAVFVVVTATMSLGMSAAGAAPSCRRLGTTGQSLCIEHKLTTGDTSFRDRAVYLRGKSGHTNGIFLIWINSSHMNAGNLIVKSDDLHTWVVAGQGTSTSQYTGSDSVTGVFFFSPAIGEVDVFQEATEGAGAECSFNARRNGTSVFSTPGCPADLEIPQIFPPLVQSLTACRPRLGDPCTN